MSRIEINADGRHVIVDHDGADLAYVIDKAETLWRAAETPQKSPGPAYGFQAERDRQWDHDRQPPVRAHTDPNA
jgi:hypothetical protein